MRKPLYSVLIVLFAVLAADHQSNNPHNANQKQRIKDAANHTALVMIGWRLRGVRLCSAAAGAYSVFIAMICSGDLLGDRFSTNRTGLLYGPVLHEGRRRMDRKGLS